MDYAELLSSPLLKISTAVLVVVLSTVTMYTVYPYVSYQLCQFAENPLKDVERRQQRGENTDMASTDHVFDEVAEIERQIKARKAQEEAGEVEKVRLSDIILKREGIKKAAVKVGREQLLETNERQNSELSRVERERKPVDRRKVNMSELVKERQDTKDATARAGREKLLSASDARQDKSPMTFAEVMELQERKQNRLMGRGRSPDVDGSSVAGTSTESTSPSRSSAETDFNSAMVGGMAPPTRVAPASRGRSRAQDHLAGFNVMLPPAEVLGDGHMGGVGSTVPAAERERERALVAEQDIAFNESLLLDQARRSEAEAEAEAVRSESPVAEGPEAVLSAEPEITAEGAVTIQFQIKLTRRKQLANQLATAEAKDTVKQSRRFLRNAPLSEVVQYIRTVCRELGASKSFEVIVPYPKHVIFSTNAASTATVKAPLEELGLTGKCVLYVHPVELEI